MHENQYVITDQVVEKLIRQQYPQFSEMPVSRIDSIGTVNAIFRIGKEYYARLPLTNWAQASLLRENTVLPILQPQVSIRIPEIIHKGKKTDFYPSIWAIYHWYEGVPLQEAEIEEQIIMESLVRFIRQLRKIPVNHQSPKAGRKPLKQLNEITINAIKACDKDIDTKKALALWQRLADTKPWDQVPVWIHADLLKPNLIVKDKKLAAIIDFGSAGVGDPAFDLVPAYSVLTAKTRETFRGAVGQDEDAWQRAKAYGLHQAVLIIPYYRNSNPRFTQYAIEIVKNILNDDSAG